MFVKKLFKDRSLKITMMTDEAFSMLHDRVLKDFRKRGYARVFGKDEGGAPQYL